MIKANLFTTLFLTIASIAVAYAGEPEPLNFNRDIRPILSAKCFACHGPDAQNRDSDFRLDTKEGAFADLGGYAGIVPGKPDESELYVRASSSDSDLLMPPPEHKKPLSSSEIALLKTWIEQSAPFAGHWAFEKVSRPAVPETNMDTTGDLDCFVAARLQREGLTFSPAASPETLLRRLHLDLTGLPPSLEELDAFLREPNDAAYEATIDRLMKTPAFAERLAMEWLDVARYADTNGYSIDDHRDMLGWRDWVIHAFQTNMPYDEFIRQQLAGDLMPNASERQKIDTVSTAFMGLTMKPCRFFIQQYRFTRMSSLGH